MLWKRTKLLKSGRVKQSCGGRDTSCSNRSRPDQCARDWVSVWGPGDLRVRVWSVDLWQSWRQNPVPCIYRYKLWQDTPHGPWNITKEGRIIYQASLPSSNWPLLLQLLLTTTATTTTTTTTYYYYYCYCYCYYYYYRIRPIKRTVLNMRTPLFSADFGGPVSAKDRLLMLNFPPEVTQTKSYTFPLAL